MPRFSAIQLQRIRRHEAKETQLQETFEAGRIRCCTYDNLVNATVDELDSLTQLIKKVKIHRKATDRMLADHLLTNTEIVEEKEINEGLLDYLMTEYNGFRGKKLKYKYGNHDKRREIIVKEN
jgi:radical SAM superfamily enzyme